MEEIEEEIELLKLELRIEVAYLEKEKIDNQAHLNRQYRRCKELKSDIEQLKIKRNHIKSAR